MKRRSLIDEYRAAGYSEVSLECLDDLEPREVVYDASQNTCITYSKTI